METVNSADTPILWTDLVCFGSVILLIVTVLWIGFRKALGNSALPSSSKEWVVVSTGSIKGLIGGLLGGSIYASIVATSIFPTEQLNLVGGIISWAIMGGLLGMAGGGLGGLVGDKRHGKGNGLVDWRMVGALLGPLVLGAGAALEISVG